ncbi:DUF5011 domain-containing protein [Clostridium baratii]
MNKKKISALIISCTIFSQFALPTISALASNLNKNDKIIESSAKESNILDSNNLKKESDNNIKNNEIVNIPDVNLKRELNSALRQKPDNPITKSQLKSLTSLSIRSSSITNLQGIQYCTNLTSLEASVNQINDISELANLTKLTSLNLSNNKISDISSLVNLRNLTSLYLSNNRISDISELANLTNLTTLYLNSNKQISNISVLSNLLKLTSLDISDNRIDDISKLSNLTNLTYLNLANNRISDINVLSNLTKLRTFYGGNNLISDISSLSKLINLDLITLQFNRINDISALSKLTNLTSLNLGNNRISDISSLSNLTNLTSLNLVGQKVFLKEIQSKGSVAEIKNDIKSVDGSIINAVNISNKGVYDSNTNIIKWNNITGDTTESYDFNKNVNIGHSNAIFSGIVQQPIKYKSNDKPVISGADNVSITEGTKFDPMAGVTATDTEDGNITKEVKVTGTVDTNKPGKYELTYTVTDKDGNTTTVKRVITVNPKMVEINNAPVIKAENRTIKAGTVFDPMSGVTASDKEDGDLTKNIKVIEDTVNTKKPGIYKVVYEVTDKQGAKAIKTITVTVISNDKPVISGADNVSITEGTKFDPMAGVTATDTEDGNITKEVKVTGTVDTNKPGKYELTYTVTDKDGNTTIVKRVITVNPKMVEINNAPVIKAENRTIKAGTVFDPMSGVTASDKEDGDLTKNIKVIEDTVNTKKPGIYKVVYEVTDKQGAKAIKTITVTVISNDKPVISGADNVSITEGTKFDPMAGVTATDTEDGNITKEVKVTGTVDTNKPGKYELTYTVTDKDGNTTIVKRVITVNPKMVEINNAPVIKAENRTIKAGTVFDPMSGVTASDKEDGDLTKNIKVIEDTVNTKKPGIYKVVYEVTDKQGAKAIKTITVTVISNDKPVISGADNVSITEGTKFDPMAGVIATDTEDGNITKEVKVTGTVDTNKPGKYELTYTVTDKDGNTTIVKRVITVNPKMVEINNAPVIKAENRTIKAGTVFDPMSGVTASDKEDGDLTKNIKVIEDTVNTKKPGIYKVVYEVTDKQGAKAIKTITVTVISNDKPVISGADNVSITEGTKFDPMAGVIATDTEDGNITKEVKVTGTVDTSKPGKYELTYTVTDKDGNTTTVKRIVIVNKKHFLDNSLDKDKPIKNESINNSNEKVILPATGITNSLPMIGSLLAISGIFVARKKDKKK